jgi:2,3-bisphosphoglycerate-independent phosphoglycerate mutase
VRFASIIGRYYAMDRDRRWERIRKAYELLVKGAGAPTTDVLDALRSSYAEGKTDEFIEPHIVVDANSKPLATIRPGDVVICFNFRTDRCREITIALTQREIAEQAMKPLPLYYVTMTEYDHTYHGVHVLFTKDDLEQTLGRYCPPQESGRRASLRRRSIRT